MKQILIFFILYSGYCYCQDQNTDNKNSTFHYTTTKDGTCIKIYYTGENFYKVYCFNYLKSHNGSLGITTNKNDTIIYSGYGENSECFDIYKSEFNNKTSVCLNITTENCIDDVADERNRKMDKIQEIPCTISQNITFLGLHWNNLNIIFRCVVYSIETPHQSNDTNESSRVKYCFNRRIIPKPINNETLWSSGIKILDKLDKILKQKTSNMFNLTTVAAPAHKLSRK